MKTNLKQYKKWKKRIKLERIKKELGVKIDENWKSYKQTRDSQFLIKMNCFIGQLVQVDARLLPRPPGLSNSNGQSSKTTSPRHRRSIPGKQEATKRIRRPTTVPTDVPKEE